jgi:hypothetical protein
VWVDSLTHSLVRNTACDCDPDGAYGTPQAEAALAEVSDSVRRTQAEITEVRTFPPSPWSLERWVIDVETFHPLAVTLHEVAL